MSEHHNGMKRITLYVSEEVFNAYQQARREKKKPRLLLIQRILEMKEK